MEDDDWDEVLQVLEADMDFDDPEVEKLYNDMDEYARRADVLADHGRPEDAQYFRELARDAYDSFVPVVQLKKGAEDYSLEVYEDG